MFYSQCWTCGERWELGTGSSCQCPDELPAYTFKPPSEPLIAATDIKPSHNITFHNGGKQMGALDFNGPEMVFTGDADESAKLFFDYIAKSFKARLEQERADERNSWPAEMEAMERQVNILTDALHQEREACAKVCDEQAERSKLAMEKSKRTTDHAVYRAGAQTAAWNAAEIRARNNT